MTPSEQKINNAVKNITLQRIIRTIITSNVPWSKGPNEPSQYLKPNSCQILTLTNGAS